VHVDYICRKQIPLLMQNNPIKSERIRAFIAQMELKLSSIEKEGFADFKFIELIYLLTVPRNAILVESFTTEINIELDDINRWKDIKDKTSIDVMYIDWLSKVSVNFKSLFFAGMSQIYEKSLAEVKDMPEEVKKLFQNPLVQEMADETEKESLTIVFDILAKGSNVSIEDAKALDFVSLAKLMNLDGEEIAKLTIDQQIQMICLSMLKDYYNRLLFLDIKDELSKGIKSQSKPIDKIKWKGTQKELGELFLELSNKNFIDEMTPKIITAISAAFDKSNTIAQVLKPTESITEEKTYDGIYTARYIKKFDNIKANKKVYNS
jgi:hypothetical protein